MQELGNHNASIRVLGIFPIVIGLVFIVSADNHASYILVAFGFLSVIAGVWLFKSKLVFYFDKNNSNIVKKKRWLWVKSIETFSLTCFSHITLGSVSASPRSRAYFVELSIPKGNGFYMQATQNIRLETFSMRKSGAKEDAETYAEELASLLNMEVKIN